MNIGNFFSKILYGIDWLIVLFILPIILAGLVTMKSFAPLEEAGFFFNKQIIWVGLGFAVFFVFSFIDFRFLKRTDVLVFIFLANSLILLALFIFGNISHGSKSWFDLGFVSFQPVDMMKLVLVLILAKYFSRRHVEIRDIKHIFISGSYAFIPFILVLLQPDFGSAMIIFLIWLGMVLVTMLPNPLSRSEAGRSWARALVLARNRGSNFCRSRKRTSFLLLLPKNGDLSALS